MKYEYFWRTRRNIDSTLISDLWRKKQDSMHPPWKKEGKAVAYLTSKPEWWLLPRRGWYQCLSLSITTHSAGAWTSSLSTTVGEDGSSHWPHHWPVASESAYWEVLSPMVTHVHSHIHWSIELWHRNIPFIRHDIRNSNSTKINNNIVTGIMIE